MSTLAKPAVSSATPFSEADFTPRVEGPPPSTREEMDRAVAAAGEAAPSFAALSLDGRTGLLEAIRRGVLMTAAPAVAAGCRAKGIDCRSPLEGEEWATGPVPVLRQVRLLCDALRDLRARGNTSVGEVGWTPAGKLRATLFPNHPVDTFLFRGVTAEVRLREGVDERMFEEERASFYRQGGHGGRVVLILGGGNIASIPPMDVLTKLFVEGKVCVLKMNPVNAYTGPFLAEAFGEAVKRGFLKVVYGGAEEGAYLCRHHGIDEIHITGSDRTHDTIVWGPPGTESETRRQRGEPRIPKPVTSELGNVSPVIVVPGPYSEAELRYQAEDLIGAGTMNASFLCNTAKIIVTPMGWQGRSLLLRQVEESLARLPTRLAFYPGAEERWHRLTEGRQRLRMYGAPGDGRLPWALIEGLDADDEGDPLFGEEAFAPVMGEVGLASPDPVEFLERAVAFANERLWGTLSATLVVHPALMKDPSTAAAVEKAVEDLRYGTVSLNAFPGLSYALASPPWGGHPSSTIVDVQSGRGWVHNTSMIEGVEKVVLRHPLTTYPRPAYHPRHRTFRTLMRRVSLLERSYSWTRFPGVALAALQG